MGEKYNNQGFLKCRYFDQMIYIPEAIYTSQSWPLFVPRQETEMAATQIPFVKTLQTCVQEIYYTILKYKNEMIFVPSFVLIGDVFTPPLFS